MKTIPRMPADPPLIKDNGLEQKFAEQYTGNFLRTPVKIWIYFGKHCLQHRRTPQYRLIDPAPIHSVQPVLSHPEVSHVVVAPSVKT